MRLKFMPGQLLLSLLVSIQMARMGRKKPSDGFCRDRATYNDSSELFPLHLSSSSVSCLNTQKTHVANAPTQNAVTEPGDSSPLQNDSYIEIHISSSLYPCFFFFLLVHVCGVRKHDFQSGMRNLAEGPYLRLPGIPEAQISQILCTKNAGHHHAVG